VSIFQRHGRLVPAQITLTRLTLTASLPVIPTSFLIFKHACSYRLEGLGSVLPQAYGENVEWVPNIYPFHLSSKTWYITLKCTAWIIISLKPPSIFRTTNSSGVFHLSIYKLSHRDFPLPPRINTQTPQPQFRKYTCIKTQLSNPVTQKHQFHTTYA
jgi:hypothetical protein